MSEQPINDGGSAFPSHPNHYSNGFYSTGEGMTLRDYFAAAALQGLMAKVDPEDHWADYRAKWSYEAADAMLKAKESK